MAPVVGDVSAVSDEEYLVLRAKDALKSDPYAAKAWMITAKTLFPNNFAVQVRSVYIPRSCKLVKSSANFEIKTTDFFVRVRLTVI
jgi:integrator complex subunit 10